MDDQRNPYWILRDLARRAIENGGPPKEPPPWLDLPPGYSPSHQVVIKKPWEL